MGGPASCVGACAPLASGHREDRNERQLQRKREEAKLLHRGLADGERDEALEQVVERKRREARATISSVLADQVSAIAPPPIKRYPNFSLRL